MQTGDFNADGKLDLAVFNHGTLSVLLGNGDGTFQAQVVTTFSLALSSSALAVGDFNADGMTDIAVTEVSSEGGVYGVAVLASNGNGTFQPAVFYPVNGSPVALAVADINKDGRLDLVAGGNGVSVLRGDGKGSFQAAMNSATDLVLGASPLLIYDFDLDGNLDVASATTASGTRKFDSLQRKWRRNVPGGNSVRAICARSCRRSEWRRKTRFDLGFSRVLISDGNETFTMVSLLVYQR